MIDLIMISLISVISKEPKVTYIASTGTSKDETTCKLTILIKPSLRNLSKIGLQIFLIIKLTPEILMLQSYRSSKL